jgi:hypothetical protein
MLHQLISHLRNAGHRDRGAERRFDQPAPPERRLQAGLPAPLVLLLITWPLAAGPLEFGKAELDRALAARGIALNYKSGVSQITPESFEIEPFRITGGDLRGLMYGLLDGSC